MPLLYSLSVIGVDALRQFLHVDFSVVCRCGLHGCVSDYSSGSRVGVVTKLSQKGVIWKSWEGSMLVALPPGQMSQPDAFTFNVTPECVEKVQSAMTSSKRVELIYRQWFISPWRIDNDHVIIDVKNLE